MRRLRLWALPVLVLLACALSAGCGSRLVPDGLPVAGRAPTMRRPFTASRTATPLRWSPRSTVRTPSAFSAWTSPRSGRASRTRRRPRASRGQAKRPARQARARRGEARRLRPRPGLRLPPRRLGVQRDAPQGGPGAGRHLPAQHAPLEPFREGAGEGARVWARHLRVAVPFWESCTIRNVASGSNRWQSEAGNRQKESGPLGAQRSQPPVPIKLSRESELVTAFLSILRDAPSVPQKVYLRWYAGNAYGRLVRGGEGIAGVKTGPCTRP